MHWDFCIYIINRCLLTKILFLANNMVLNLERAFASKYFIDYDSNKKRHTWMFSFLVIYTEIACSFVVAPIITFSKKKLGRYILDRNSVFILGPIYIAIFCTLGLMFAICEIASFLYLTKYNQKKMDLLNQRESWSTLYSLNTRFQISANLTILKVLSY